jgi:P pilus assembly chaperone PapD
VGTRRARATALAVLAFAGLAARPARAQLTVDQLELVINPATPLTRTAVFTVRNEAETPQQATVSVGDWDRDEGGVNQFYPSGTRPQSCGGRLKVFPLTLRLDPGAAQQVRVTLERADSLSGLCTSIVFLETTRRDPVPQRGAQLVYVLRTGVKVYVQPPGLARDGGIEELSVQPHVRNPNAPNAAADSSTIEAVVAFRNAGGLPLSTKGTIEVRRPDNSVAAKVEVPMFPTLPGALRRVAVPLPPLGPGQYVILVLLDFGGAEIAAGQLDFEAR